MILRQKFRIVDVTAGRKDRRLAGPKRHDRTVALGLDADGPAAVVDDQSNHAVAEKNRNVPFLQSILQLLHHVHAEADTAIAGDRPQRTPGRNLVLGHVIQVIGGRTIECEHAPLGQRQRALVPQGIDSIGGIVIESLEQLEFGRTQTQLRCRRVVLLRVGKPRHVFDTVGLVVCDSPVLQREIVGDPQHAGGLGRGTANGWRFLHHQHRIAVFVCHHGRGARPDAAADHDDIGFMIPLAGRSSLT